MSNGCVANSPRLGLVCDVNLQVLLRHIGFLFRPFNFEDLNLSIYHQVLQNLGIEV